MNVVIPPHHIYSVGEQPCSNYTPRLDPYGRSNVHECFGPYLGHYHDPAFPVCGKRVSFCEACKSDHHEGGWVGCGQNEP